MSTTTTPVKKTETSTPPPAVQNANDQTPPLQRNNSASGIGSTPTTLQSAPTDQPASTQETVTRSWFNPAWVFKGSTYTVTKPAPTPTTTAPSLSAVSSTSTTTESKKAAETTAVDQKKTEEKSVEQAPKPQPSYATHAKGVLAMVTNPIAKVAGREWVYDEKNATLSLDKVEPKTTETNK